MSTCRFAKTPVLLLRLSLLIVCCVAITARAERLPIKTYTTADGLAHNDVNRIVRDSRGFLWFCTFEGLSRFDGYTFTTLGVDQGLPSPAVNDLLETGEGQYWVATAAGLCRFNPKGIAQPRAQRGGQASAATNAMFTVYVPGDDPGSRNVTHLLQDSAGATWCGTARGLYRIEQQSGQVVFHLVHVGMPTEAANYIFVTSIIEDKRSTLWVGSENGIFRLLADGRLEHYQREQNGLPSDDVHSLLEDREGRIWVAMERGGLCRLVSDPHPARLIVARAYTEKDGLATKWINQLFQSSDGALWAGSNQGLISFIPTADGRDFRFRAYAESHGLTYREVISLAEDRNGNLWAGMLSGGVAKIARSGITAFGKTDGFAFASSVLKDRSGHLVVAGGTNRTSYYINRFDGEKFTAIQLRLPTGFEYGWGWNQLVVEDRVGEWWAASNHGLYRFPRVDSFEQLGRTPPKAIYTVQDGLAGNEVLRVFEDSRGDIWISSIGVVHAYGLSRWERATKTFHHYTESEGLPSLMSFYAISFCEDRAGDVWIGFSFGGGLVRYRAGRFTRFTSADGLPEGGIFNLFADSSGRLWIPTTRGGLCRTDNPEAEGPAFSTLTTADGLASNNLRCVTEDRRGRIYVGNGRGIDRLDLATGHIRHYTAADGVPLGDIWGALQDSDGTLWFSFGTGLIRLVPEPDQPPLPPPTLITGLSVAGSARTISVLGESEVLPIELGANENALKIDFVAIGFSPGEGLRYQYLLDGANEEWSPLTDQRTVNFANLAPGRYRFRVRAVNSDGALSENPANFSFTILPPIWRRWWFLALAGALMALIAYVLYQYRVARLVELERVRTRIAADLHDDIGSSLSQISILSEVLRKQLGPQEAHVSKSIFLINRVSQEALDSMSDIVWAINPRQDHLSDLVRRMRRVASETLPARDIEFTFSVPTAGQDLRVGADVRRQVFLMFKETINNIVRHSRCKMAQIELKIEGAWLVLTVADNGKGFDPIQVSEGNGLVSLRRRASSLGGESSVSSRPGDGTTIRVKIPRGDHIRSASGDGKQSGNGETPKQ
jgi:ligand-binding sensor domain-containing protein/signal transduction histidine kinase